MSQSKWWRVNRQIKISPVLVVSEGENLGVMSVERALDIAFRKGLDLVEIAPTSKPPVCKIIDYNKFKYEQKVKDKKNKHPKSQQVKELRFRPCIASHDLEVKINSAQRFLLSGNKVQIKIEFRRRENIHKELGINLINQVVDSLVSVGKLLSPPRLEGRYLGCIFEPLQK